MEKLRYLKSKQQYKYLFSQEIFIKKKPSVVIIFSKSGILQWTRVSEMLHPHQCMLISVTVGTKFFQFWYQSGVIIT